MEISQPFAIQATYGLGNSKLRKKNVRKCNEKKKIITLVNSEKKVLLFFWGEGDLL